MSSNFILAGGFFLVERCISADSFLSSRTLTEAEYIDNETLVSLMARWSTGFGGGAGAGVGVLCGVDEPAREENKEEKKLPPTEGLVMAMTFGGRMRFFSEPDV